ncbi:hypothetical protein ACOCJ7_15595 [Knoellia sp. CPCC 206453]
MRALRLAAAALAIAALSALGASSAQADVSAAKVGVVTSNTWQW